MNQLKTNECEGKKSAQVQALSLYVNNTDKITLEWTIVIITASQDDVHDRQ